MHGICGPASSAAPAGAAEGGERNRRDGCAGSRVRLSSATARSARRWLALPALSLCWLACSDGADPVPTTSNRGLVREERVPGREGLAEEMAGCVAGRGRVSARVGAAQSRWEVPRAGLERGKPPLPKGRLVCLLTSWQWQGGVLTWGRNDRWVSMPCI